jgi:hypothetical protein
VFGRAVAALTVVAAGAGLVAACGDDDDSIAKSEFIRRADAVCTDYNERLEAAGQAAFPSEDVEPSADDIEAFAATIADLVRDQVDELRDLPDPDEGADEIEDLLDDVEARADDIEELGEDPETFFEEGETIFEDLDARARDYGFEVCGGDES